MLKKWWTTKQSLYTVLVSFKWYICFILSYTFEISIWNKRITLTLIFSLKASEIKLSWFMKPNVRQMRGLKTMNDISPNHWNKRIHSQPVHLYIHYTMKVHRSVELSLVEDFNYSGVCSTNTSWRYMLAIWDASWQYVCWNVHTLTLEVSVLINLSNIFFVHLLDMIFINGEDIFVP